MFAGQGFTEDKKRRAILQYKKLLRKQRKVQGAESRGTVKGQFSVLSENHPHPATDKTPDKKLKYAKHELSQRPDRPHLPPAQLAVEKMQGKKPGYAKHKQRPHPAGNKTSQHPAHLAKGKQKHPHPAKHKDRGPPQGDNR